MRRLGQHQTRRRSRATRGTRGHGLEQTARRLVPQSGRAARVGSHQAPHAGRRMPVQGVGDTMPPRRVRIRGHWAGALSSRVLVSPCRAQRRHPAGALRDVARGAQGPRTPADICARAAFRAPWSQGERGLWTRQGLETWHRVGGPPPFPGGPHGWGLQGEGGHLGPGLLGSLVRRALEPGATPRRFALALMVTNARRGAPHASRPSPVGSPRRPTRAAARG